MSTLVWVKLYVKGERKDTSISPFPIEEAAIPLGGIIAGLAKAVKTELRPKIDHAPVHEIEVYPCGTTMTADGVPQGNKIDMNAPLKTDSTAENPLIVVAPAPPQVTPEKDDMHMGMLVSHWSNSKLFDGKRPRETETFSEARKKPAVEKKVDVAPTNDDDNQTMQAGGKTCVRVFPPKEGFQWYLGEEDEAFYLRACVDNLGSLVLNDIWNTEKLRSGPWLYIISGASGIGKSWSINAFMAALLGAKKKVFFHHGATGRAWKITDGDTVQCVDAGNITVLDKEWVYVYDSPGSKSKSVGGPELAAFHRTGRGNVTLIFSSPKAQNYRFAVAKGGGVTKFFNLPTWKREEMMEVEKVKDSDPKVFNACYDIWGGNMRAVNEFLQQYQATPVLQELTELAEKELDACIEKIDKDFAQKMTEKLEKQEVEGQFTGLAIGNTPGHILVPEPIHTDPSEPKCFTEFLWRFCSPLAEKKFWKHAKKMDHDALKKLLISVFRVPSPKGVLFEKVAHTLITNGVVETVQMLPLQREEQRDRNQLSAVQRGREF